MKPWEKKLMPYANVVALITSKVERATPLELLELSRACAKPNQTNCWWATHRAAEFIRPIVQAERLRRRRK